MATEISTEISAKISIDNMGEQFSIMLGEENNTQYWFVMVPDISLESAKYITRCIVYGMKKLTVLANNEMLYACIEKPDIVKPTLVMLYGKYTIEDKDNNKEFIIAIDKNVDQFEDFVQCISKLMNFALEFIREDKSSAKTIIRTEEYIKVEEAVIYKRNIEYLKYLLVGITSRDNKGKNVGCQFIEY